MPPKKRTIDSSMTQARKKRAIRASETHEQRDARLKTDRELHDRACLFKTNEQRDARLETDRRLYAWAR